MSLRFELPQLEPRQANPLVRLVSHSGPASTSITPAATSVLSGATVTFSWSYTAGGTSGADVAYKYTGKELDDSTGLYFYEARYYDPDLGRFISADTIVPSVTDPQALNRYSYARNNPILFTNPSGHFFKKQFKSIKKAFKKFEKAGWKYRHYWNPSTIAIDYALTNPTIGPYARMVGAAAASYFGPVAATGFAAYTTRLDGGSFGDVIKAGAIAGGTAYAFGQADLYLGDSVSGIAAHGVIGGTSAELQGGSFVKGFAISAGTKSLSVAAIKMRETMLAQSEVNPNNSSGTSARFRGDGRKLAGGRCIVAVDCAAQRPSPLGGVQGGKGSIFGIPYGPGSFADLFAEAYAGPHDFLNSPYWYTAFGNAKDFLAQGSLYGKFLDGFGEVYSAANVLVATPFVAASVIPSSAYIPLLGR